MLHFMWFVVFILVWLTVGLTGALAWAVFFMGVVFLLDVGDPW